MNYKSHNREEGVVILVTILSVGLFALGLAITLALNTASQVAKNRNVSMGDALFYTADAQAREAAYQFINDPDNYTGGDFFELNGASNGSLTVTDIGWPYYEIESKSTNNLIERSIIYTITIYPGAPAFEHAIYSSQDLEISGSVEIEGDIFSNGNLNFNGNPPINGDVYAGGTADESNNNVSGEEYSDVEPIPAPDVNLDFYRDEAQANGTYFESATEAENYINNNIINENDVLFVDNADDSTFNIDEQMTGAVITTGDLRINGGEYTAFDGHFAVISAGDARFAGNAVIYGVVYVEGQATFAGGGATIEGSLIASQGVSDETSIGGNVSITYNPDYIFVTEDNSTTDDDPVIIRWREE